MAEEPEIPFFVKIYHENHPPDYIRLDRIICLYRTDEDYKVEYDSPADVCFFYTSKECFEGLVALLEKNGKIIDTTPKYENGGWQQK